MGTLKMYLFGGIKICKDSNEIDFDSIRTKALLSYLAIYRKKSHSRAGIASTFWSPAIFDHPRHNLKTALAVLRKNSQVSGYLGETGDKLQFQTSREDKIWIDVEEFTKLLTGAKELPSAHRRHLELLTEAFDLYKGEFLYGLDDVDLDGAWIPNEREKHKAYYIEILQYLIEALKPRRRLEKAVEYCERALKIYPTEDKIHYLLLSLLCVVDIRRARRQADESERVLKEIGELSQETRGVITSIRQPAKPVAIEDEAARARYLISRFEEPMIPFVNRELEYDKLRRFWTDCCNGNLRVALVLGESGIGKSKLIREFTKLLSDEGQVVIAGECPIDAQSLEPIIVALRSYFATHSDISLLQELPSWAFAELREMVPALQSVLTDIPKNPDLSRGQAQLRKSKSIAEFFRILARHTPCCLWIDDVHLADHETLRCIQRIAYELSHEKALLILSYRSENLKQNYALNSLSDSLLKRGFASKPLRVKKLLDRYLKSIIKLLLQPENEDDSIARRLSKILVEPAKGNPFFAIETLRWLAQDRLLYARKGETLQLAIKAIPRQHIPRNIQQLVSNRASSVNRLGRTVLELASIYGEKISVPLLANALQRSENEILGALDALKAAYLLREGSRGYTFYNDTVREAIFQGLGHGKTVKLHIKISNALRELNGNGIQPVTYLTTAARKSVRNFHWYKEGLRLLSRAWKLADNLEKSGTDKQTIKQARFNILVEKADTLYYHGDLKKLERVITSMSSLAQALSTQWAIARVHRWKNMFLITQGDLTSSLEEAKKALSIERSIGDKTGDKALTGSELQNLGASYLWNSKFEEALGCFEEAYQIWQNEKVYKTSEAKTLNALGAIHCILGEYTKALQYLQLVDSDREQVWDQAAVADTFDIMGQFYTNLGMYEKSLEYLDEALRLAKAVGNQYWKSSVLTHKGLPLVLSGNGEDALRFSKQAINLLKKVQDGKVDSKRLGEAYLVHGEINAELNKFKRAVDCFKEAIKWSEQSHLKLITIESLVRLSAALLALGKKDEAFEQSTKAQTYLQEISARIPKQVPYYVHYRILRAIAGVEPGKIKNYLANAQAELKRIASNIQSDEQRKSFLEIRIHQEILQTR